MAEKYLIKLGNTILSSHYILEGGWSTTPNQRMENDAYRDANGDLHRETTSHTKSKITITIKPLRLAQMRELRKIINNATITASDRLQRRVTATYWNDEDLAYTTGTFYMPDIDYTIKRIESDGTIVYDQFDLKLIEY